MSNVFIMRDQIDGVITRATSLIDEESRALRERRDFDHGAIVGRKNMIAFELETIARMAERCAPDAELRQRFSELRSKLEDNRKLLEIHIGASRQIVRILAEVVRACESDGTYDVARPSRGKRRD